MIPAQLIHLTRNELRRYRGDGVGGHILFDGRDQGHYSDYAGEDDLIDMLLKADPTGLAAALLVNERIEATIKHSKVQLSRVLREAGFVEQLQSVLLLQRQLQEAMGDLPAKLIATVDEALAATAGQLGGCTQLEVAVCLRDAIYSMDRGLRLRWVMCLPDAPVVERLPLCTTITRHESISDFVEALRHDMPYGASLARIGLSHTAIGIKTPGRIAFLSSLSIDTMGRVIDEGARERTHVEAIDLQTCAERYPEWVDFRRDPRWDADTGEDRRRRAQEMRYATIGDLPRDRLVWLAMVVEIAGQRLAAVDPAKVELTEVVRRALPGLPSHQRLPALLEPNWRAEQFELGAALRSLEFSDWELRFFAPALKGRTAEDFLPVSHEEVMLPFDGGPPRALPRDSVRGTSGELPGEWLHTLDPGWAGTREETENARWAALRLNLADFLLEWGARRWEAEMKAFYPWLKSRLEAAMPAALAATCVSFGSPDSRTFKGAHLFVQSPSRSTYAPRCYLAGTKPPRGTARDVTHGAIFRPRSGLDLAAMLGLDEEALPEFLRGWALDCSWACERSPQGSRQRPVPTGKYWAFTDADPVHSPVEASVSFNVANASEEVRRLVEAQSASKDGRERHAA